MLFPSLTCPHALITDSLRVHYYNLRLEYRRVLLNRKFWQYPEYYRIALIGSHLTKKLIATRVGEIPKADRPEIDGSRSIKAAVEWIWDVHQEIEWRRKYRRAAEWPVPPMRRRLLDRLVAILEPQINAKFHRAPEPGGVSVEYGEPGHKIVIEQSWVGKYGGFSRYANHDCHRITVCHDWLRRCRHYDIPGIVVLWVADHESRYADGSRVLEAIWSRPGNGYKTIVEHGQLMIGPRGGVRRVPRLIDKLRTGHDKPIQLYATP